MRRNRLIVGLIAVGFLFVVWRFGGVAIQAISKTFAKAHFTVSLCDGTRIMLTVNMSAPREAIAASIVQSFEVLQQHVRDRIICPQVTPAPDYEYLTGDVHLIMAKPGGSFPIGIRLGKRKIENFGGLIGFRKNGSEFEVLKQDESNNWVVVRQSTDLQVLVRWVGMELADATINSRPGTSIPILNGGDKATHIEQ